MDLLGPVIAMARSGGQLESVVDDLLTVRRALAAAVLRRLSRGITPEDLRRVSKAIDGFGDAAERNASHQELAIADGQILIALLGATGSPVLGLCLNPILRVLADLPALSEAMYARPGENLVGWRLFEAWLAAPSSFPLDEIIGQLEKRDEHTLSRLRGLQ
jgi:DNA-binding GntR family transcriptional regulator